MEDKFDLKPDAQSIAMQSAERPQDMPHLRDGDLPIGQEQVDKALITLKEYKDGKANLEQQIIANEQWWKLLHWDEIRGASRNADAPEPTSAWLFNAIANKHADAMDNYPEPLALPRERSDEESAKTLSSVLPVVMEYNSFEDTYNDVWWEKLKHGTGIYGVFWNSDKENGLGDIDIQNIDLLKIYWEPGITNIQDSRNVFTVDLVDEDILVQQYPQLEGKTGGDAVDVAKYLYEDTIDTSKKRVVVDWYYKVINRNGRKVLHYARFVGHELLFSSENLPEYEDKGWYWHGLYPFRFDVLFPEKDTPTGFGYVNICKDPQLFIDKLMGNILEKSMMNTKTRYFASSTTNVNEEEFLDWNRPIVHVEGEIDERRLKEIVNSPLDGIYANIVQMKIDEMKETASNRDVSAGGTSSGVTAAAAISALQEAGNKVSRDMIAASYRAQVDIVRMCVELMRQFYDVQRTFRITNEMPYEYAEVGNGILGDQPNGYDAEGNKLFRRPIFDIKIKAQKKNPFSRAEQNERAKELYGLGFFNPEHAQEALLALDMMDFEGIDKIKRQISEGATLMNLLQQSQQQVSVLSAALSAISPQTLAALGFAPVGQDTQQEAGRTSMAQSGVETPASGMESKSAAAQTPMTDYGTRLARRSVPDMSTGAAT